ncbi:MAG: carbohydrate ABC transporter permease [Beutenbergiaceae bacterium]
MSATVTPAAPSTVLVSRKRSRIKPLLWWLLAVAMVLPSLLPLLWLASASFKTYIQTQAIPPVWFPRFNLDNYIEILKGPRIDYFINSAFISVITVILVSLLAIPAAYGLSRFRTNKTRDLQFWIVSMRMIPPLAMVVPVYVYFSFLGLTGTRIAIICMLTMANGAFATWLCTTFFDEVPVEVEEAAKLDGLGHYQVFLRVALPLARTGVLTVLGFVFIFAWNELPFSLVLASQQSQPFPVYLTTFNGTTFIDYGLMAAACMLYVTPVVLVTLLMQRQLVAGLSFGAVK